MPPTIEEVISALKYISSLDLIEPEIFVNANNNLAVRYKYYNVEGEHLNDWEYGVWVINLFDGAKLQNIS